MRGWYATRAAFPTLEAPVLLRTLFAAGGDRAGLLASLRDCEQDAEGLLGALRQQAAGYEEGGGPFPDRLPYIALNGIFLLGWLTWLRNWAGWAAAQVEALPDDADEAGEQALALLAELAAGAEPEPLITSAGE